MISAIPIRTFTVVPAGLAKPKKKKAEKDAQMTPPEDLMRSMGARSLAFDIRSRIAKILRQSGA
jgi:hypothetical protein